MANKLSDEEIFRMIEEFEALSPEDRKSHLLGKGRGKLAYNTSNPDYVLKKVRMGGVPEDLYDSHSMIGEYLDSKKIKKDLPGETPILVTKPSGHVSGHNAYHIQRKLSPLDDSGLEQMEQLIEQGKDKYGYSNLDLHRYNFGKDPEGNLKVFDFDNADLSKADPGFDKTRRQAIQKIAGNANKVPRIYRSIPLIGPAIAGAAAIATQDANAAIPLLNEAENLGPEPGSEDWEIENPQRNPQLRQQALQRLLKK